MSTPPSPPSDINAASVPKRPYVRGAGLQAATQIGVSLLVVMLFTTLVLWLAGAPPLAAYEAIFKGSLGSWTKLSHVIKAWIPLTLCACGLLFTFRIGLWNIGVEGQVMMGAVFATAALRWGVSSPHPSLYIVAAFAMGMLGGGVWAILAGLLKTRGGVHEIFAGLGLNFVAQGIILWLIFGPWKRPGVASMSGTELFPRELWLSYLNQPKISPVGLGLAVAGLLVTAAVIGRTRIGLSLKAIGKNPRAAYLFGLHPTRYMLLAMLLAGGLAGMAGTLQVAGVYHRLIPAISSNYGYLGLLVVMLANYNVWALPAVALFFVALNVGSIQLPMILQMDSSLSGVIQGATVLAVLAVQGVRLQIARRRAVAPALSATPASGGD